MRYLAMIQARCGSTRLPNKILMDLCGKPALQRMIERVQRSHLVDEVMVVTSIEKNNLPVLALCAQMGVRVFAGSENDVLDRYYQAARLLQPEYVIRLTADCPCFDAQLLDDAIATMDKTADYRSMMSETFPDGMDLEIMRFDALQTAWQKADLASQREHVTQYILKSPQFCRQDYVSSQGNFGHYRWTVDEPEDYALVQKIYEHFLSQNNEFFTYADLLQLMQEQPALAQMNARYARNEGLAKSLKNDFVVEHTQG